MRRLILGVWCLLSMVGRAGDEWHTFTDLAGRQMVAKAVRVEAALAVLELKAGGQQVSIAFDKLSALDVLFLQRSKESPAPVKPEVLPDAQAPAREVAAGRLLYPRTRKEIEAGIREIAKRPRPKDLSVEVHEATKQLNIYRFLCGVPAEVKGDAECSKNAGDAALACKQAGTISHSLGHSTNRCNLSTMGNVVASVSQYMEDGGANNREGRGHRAWCLNPPMGKVGFGSGGKSFSAMWCMDASGKSQQGTWAYPGMGLFPVEYMHGSAWSLYGVDAATIPKVEIVRLAKRPEQPFPATGDIPGRQVKVLHVSRAMMNGINFEPAEPAKRGIYWVRVTGAGLHEGYLVELY